MYCATISHIESYCILWAGFLKDLFYIQKKLQTVDTSPKTPFLYISTVLCEH